jgi:hypothetical protein
VAQPFFYHQQASADLWNRRALPASIERLVACAEDLIGLAEFAMHKANRDGGEFGVEAELKEIRDALASAKKEIGK